MDNTRGKAGIYSCFTILSLLATPIFAAANFNIDYTPGQPIPSSVSNGGTVSAYYTVTNNTKTTRAGYTVKGLPVTVTQNAGVGYCANPVTLSGHASCILKLDITGQVKSYFSLCRGASCTQAARPLAVAAQVKSLGPLVAGGVYLTTQSLVQPLIATSNDNGATWAYTLSSSPSQAAIQSVFCKKNICFAGGGSTSSPIIYTSTTSGLTWTNTLSTTPLPYNYVDEGRFTGISCNENVCVAGGNYRSSTLPPISAPMIAISQNNGTSWNYTLDAQTPPADFENLSSDDQVNNVSCTANYCVYGKAYLSNDSNHYPLVATSNAQGTTWNYTLDSSGDFPMGFDSFKAREISCHNSVCILVGGYNNSPQLPVIFTGTNNGTQWTYTLDGSNLPAGATTATFAAAKCNDQYCIAAGNYTNGGVQYPMIATSTNNSAAIWNYTLITPPSQLDNEAEFYSISCSGVYCVAVGNYKKSDGHWYPMIVRSKDSGLHWEYTFDGNTPLPTGFVDVGLGSVSCRENVCIAAGGANYIGDGFAYPVLILSTDYGMTWNYKITNTTPQLPNGFDIGFFYSAASSSTAFLPNSLKFLNNHS